MQSRGLFSFVLFASFVEVPWKYSSLAHAKDVCDKWEKKKMKTPLVTMLVYIWRGV